VRNYAGTIDNARGKQYDYTTISQRMNMGIKELTVTTEKDEKAQKKATDAKKKAAEAAKKYADTLRDRVKTAVETTTDAVERAQAEFDNFADTIASAIGGSVSLASAFQTQAEADQAVTDAFKDRSDAYTALQKLNPTEDAQAYADALNRVADAEKAVTGAQTKRAKSNYGQVFADQIQAAKEFGERIRVLVQDRGLQQAGLQQLLNLGPEAGNVVAHELIMGTGSMSVADINTGLAGLSAKAGQVGLASASAFFGGSLAGAQGNAAAVNQYSITVNAGLVSNPAQVGRDIIEAIKKAERVSGQVFVSV
jgi:hypothetical protein